MLRKLVAAVLLAGVGVAGTAASAQAATTCTSTSVKVTRGAVTVTDTVRSCAYVRGGWSKSKSHKVSKKTSAGTISDTRTDTQSKLVSTKGKITMRVSVRICHKDAGAKETCKSTTTTK